MKIVIALLFATILLIPVLAYEDDCEFLARVLANEMKNEPFIVKIAYCEMLVNRLDSEKFPDTLLAVAYSLGAKRGKAKPSEGDYRAAAIALQRYGFFKDVYYMEKWQREKSTPQFKNCGVRLYDWYFYQSSTGSM